MYRLAVLARTASLYTARKLPATLCRPAVASFTRSFALRRSTRNTLVPTGHVIDVIGSAEIVGEEGSAPSAEIKVKPGMMLRVDPASIVCLPQGISVKPVSAAVPYHPSHAQAPAPVNDNRGPLLAELVATPELSRNAEELNVIQLAAESATATLLPIDLNNFGGDLYIAENALLACDPDIEVTYVPAEHELAQATGMRWLRVRGSSNLIIRAQGSAIEKELMANETVYVTAARLAAVEASAHVRGGAGVLFHQLSGPGKALLQTQPAMALQVVNGQPVQTFAGQQVPAHMQASSGAGGMMGGGGMGLGSMLMQGAAMGVGVGLGHAAVNSLLGGGGHSAAPAETAAPLPEETQTPDDAVSGGGDSGGGLFGSFFGGDSGSNDSGGFDDDGGDDGEW